MGSLIQFPGREPSDEPDFEDWYAEEVMAWLAQVEDMANTSDPDTFWSRAAEVRDRLATWSFPDG